MRILAALAILCMAILAVSAAAPEYVNCIGNPSCNEGGVKRHDCDRARNMLRPDKKYILLRGSVEKFRHRGVCSGTCSLYVKGFKLDGKRECALSGKEMVAAYDDIRKNGCQNCGMKILSNGCGVGINYIEPEQCWM